jgi:hypothetical protein
MARFTKITVEADESLGELLEAAARDGRVTLAAVIRQLADEHVQRQLEAEEWDAMLALREELDNR